MVPRRRSQLLLRWILDELLLLMRRLMVTEQRAVLPHRQDLVLDVVMVIEKRNNMFPSNYSDEEREWHIFLL